MRFYYAPLIGRPFHSASVLYWSTFVYHFLLSTKLSMLSISLPVIIKFVAKNGFNPVAFAMGWNFASGGKIFVYQSAVLILGYSGYFESRDVIRVGLILAVVEGVICSSWRLSTGP